MPIPLPYKDKQKAYEARRAALRPEINRLYGHLAKAEKPEPAAEVDLEALEPHSAPAEMLHDIQPIRDNGT